MIEEEVKIILRASQNSSTGRLYAVRPNGDVLPIENWYDSIIVTSIKPNPKPCWHGSEQYEDYMK